jgi:orotidine-5'-phosphate decarboxylase
MGSPGWKVLEETIRMIPGHIPVIIDAKRGDIGNTAAMYARSVFELLGADAVTVNPYLGWDSVKPFAEYVDKGIFVLCLTSNKSSSDLQKQLILLENPPEADLMTPQSKAKTFAEFFGSSVKKTYEYVADLAVEWNKSGNLGLVVGATAPAELGDIRKIIGDDMPVLIPGVGAQGGDLEKSIEFGSDSAGEQAIINISRGIIYSWTGEGDFRTQVRQAALLFRERISKAVGNKAAGFG